MSCGSTSSIPTTLPLRPSPKRETAQLFDVISISAGMRGLQILLVPDDYIRAVGAKVVSIAKGKN